MAPDSSGTSQWASHRHSDVGGLGRDGRLGVTALSAGAFCPLSFMPAMAPIPRPYPGFLTRPGPRVRRSVQAPTGTETRDCPVDRALNMRPMPAAVLGAVDRTLTIWEEWRTHRIAQFRSVDRFIELREWVRAEFPKSRVLDRRVLREWAAGHAWRKTRHRIRRASTVTERRL